MPDEDGSRSKRLQELLGKKSETTTQWPDVPKDLSGPEFDTTLSKYPVCVVDFWAVRCQPCKIMAPMLDQLAKEYQGKVFFGKVNTDENLDITNKLGIRSIPTFCIYKNGEMVQKGEGIIPKKDFISLFTPYI